MFNFCNVLVQIPLYQVRNVWPTQHKLLFLTDWYPLSWWCAWLWSCSCVYLWKKEKVRGLQRVGVMVERVRKVWGSVTLPSWGFWPIFILGHKESGNSNQFCSIKFSELLSSFDMYKFLARYECGKAKVCLYCFHDTSCSEVSRRCGWELHLHLISSVASS